MCMPLLFPLTPDRTSPALLCFPTRCASHYPAQQESRATSFWKVWAASFRPSPMVRLGAKPSLSAAIVT